MVLATGQISLTDLNDTKQYILYLNGTHKTQIFDPNAGVYTPSFATSNLLIKPELFISGGTGENLMPSANVKSVRWYEGTDTTSPLAETLTGTTSDNLSYAIPTGTTTTTNKTLTLKSNLASLNNKAFTCVVTYTDTETNFDITLKALYEIVKITNGVKGAAGASGENAMTLALTNESVTIPTDQSGNGGIYTGSGTNVNLYEGATALQYDGVGTANGTFKVLATATGITAGAITDGGAYAIVAPATAMTTDTATISFMVTGKRLDGSPINLAKTQSFAKAKTGVAPTAYWLISSIAAINRNETGAYTPTSIVATGMAQTGAASPAAYSTYYRFSESTDGSTFNTKQTSGANAATATFTLSTQGLKAVKIDMFRAGGTTVLLDSVTVPVVSDGSSGVDAFYLNVWAPEGDTVRNSAGVLKLQADLYKGSGQVTPTAYKWYAQDPGSAGDSDSGAGWKLLTSTYTQGTSNYTTAILQVPASSIAGVEGFMCIVTGPGGTKYRGVIVVRDFQDPVIVNVLGTAVYKNGVGESTFTAQLIQAGSEIPSTGHTFVWALYNSTGTLIKTYPATGPSVTVPASDISGTANLIVDVSKP